jgi:hypothetical protein
MGPRNHARRWARDEPLSQSEIRVLRYLPTNLSARGEPLVLADRTTTPEQAFNEHGHE